MIDHRKLGEDPDDTCPLSEYWEIYQLSVCEPSTPPESPRDSVSSLKSKRIAFQRSRALSDSTALLTSKHVLAAFHPALSLPEFIDTFGPLIFPLYRAALLRKRILLVGEAPVELSCNFGKGISVTRH